MYQKLNVGESVTIRKVASKVNRSFTVISSSEITEPETRNKMNSSLTISVVLQYGVMNKKNWNLDSREFVLVVQGQLGSTLKRIDDETLT